MYITCPHCKKKEVELPYILEWNAEKYLNSVYCHVLPCCGKAVTAYGVVHLRIAPYQGSKELDSWGNPIKKD